MLLNTLVALKYAITVSATWGCKMRRSELIARLNSLRYDVERLSEEISSVGSNYNLETIETCLYYFLDEEDADPHWE